MVAPRRQYRSVIADSARWDGFGFREGDIVISTSPKSGTTWMQMLCALLVFDSVELDRPLSAISPWLDMQTAALPAVVAMLEAQSHRRFIKTHTPLDGLPFDERVTYLCVGRDPRDMFLSWDHHMANLDVQAIMAARAAAVGLDDLSGLGRPAAALDDHHERFRRFVDGEPTGEGRVGTLADVLHHVHTFWDERHRPNVELFHYCDLAGDPVGQLRRLADVLAIDVADERIDALAGAASFDRMRARADELAPDVGNRIWHSNTEFFHRGSSGQWRDLVDGDDLGRYDERVAELVPAELATWAHHGWSGADLVEG